MYTMSTKTPSNRMYVRPSPDARYALRTLLLALQAPSRFGEELTQEDMVSATWLWMAEMKVGEIEAGIKPHVEEVRAWRASRKRKKPAPPVHGEDEDVHPAKKRKRG